MTLIATLAELRANRPEIIAETLQRRPRGAMPVGDAKLMIIACDHPARGALAVGDDPMAMASREELLARCVEALRRPGVNGFLGTADMIEDLALLGALDGKLVFGSMNRGGLAGSCFEMDDRRTGFDSLGIARSGLDGGKMLLRVNYRDPGTAATLEWCGRAVDELAERHLLAMVEPFVSVW
ncbi:MAG: deoxyribose-phosphate aldolase, partial [Propionibacterium sp.]